MMHRLKVIAPGLHTTLQDLGRPGFQSLGVPVSGALDPVSFRLANLLAGNEENTGALEILFQGPTLEVLSTSARFALAGGKAEAEILVPQPGRIPAWRSFTLPSGGRFRIHPKGAAVCYLAVEGGFAIAPVLGSQSTYVRGGIGGYEGRALQAGDGLPLTLGNASGRGELGLPPPNLAAPAEIRVIPGPQDDFFTEAALTTFFSARFTVSQASDRMGLRLEGPPLLHAKGADIVSDGIAHGAIQVPGSGKPIILLADRQTAGGYPKIATVISADLAALGRLAPGAKLSFRKVNHEEAAKALRTYDEAFAALKASIAPLDAQAPLESRALLSGNLISGVVDAHDPRT